MLNKKTIAVKESDRGQIIRVTADMTPAELAEVQATVSRLLSARTLQGILSQIGRVYEVPFSDGRSTFGVILTYEGVRSIGIDLNTLFKCCGGREEFNEKTDVRNGVLVNLDLYQQVALLKAIIEIKQELADVLGLYNLRGSRKVYEALSRAGILGQLGIWWMWTGERYIVGQNSEWAYPEEEIVTLLSLSALISNRFGIRGLIIEGWYQGYPNLHNFNGAAVFGALK
jgi:hypothetical protein